MYYNFLREKITYFIDDFELTYSDFISSDFNFFYYNNSDWLTLRPINLYDLYPDLLFTTQDPCYSGYTYNDPNFEGTYFGTSTTPTGQLLFVYKQFNTDILFQSIHPPTPTFKPPTKSSTLQVQSDFNNLFIGIKLTNTDDAKLLLTTD